MHFALFLFSVSLPTTAASDPVLHETRHRLAHLGLDVVERRVLDPSTGRIERLATDEAGRAVDLDRLLLEERRLRIAANGNMSSELAARVREAEPSEVLDVVFWLVEPEHPDFLSEIRARVALGQESGEARRAVAETARAVFEPGNAAFAARLADAGFEIVLVGGIVPDVFARLPAGAVGRWASLPEVDLAYLASTEGYPELQYAQGTMRTFNVHDQGVTGATGPAKVLVNDCGNVPTHTNLPPIVTMTGSSAQSHAAGVAGNIASNHATNFAAAKGLAQIYSAAGCSDAGAQTAWSWGISQGIDFGNCSWWNGQKCQIRFLDRYFDYIIRNFSVMLFKSNGNQGTTAQPCATTPGNGYNMTCTGAYNDGNNYNWAGDFMASYSSWQNPLEGHEKPEVASPGDGCTTTSTSNGFQNFSGTSSASPLTCGVAVLLANEDPSLLGAMPLVKAALMVGAWHNVEGGFPVSERDGAGGVHAAASHALVRDGQFETGTFTASSFPAGYYDKVIPLLAGDETRVIALWFSDPDSAYATDVLKMDLDVAVLDPGGQTVASSASPYNAWDLVQFTPPVTGNYTIRLTMQRFLGTSEPYAIAWSTKQDAAVADVAFTGTPAIGTTLQVAFRERYDASVPYVGAASFGTLPSFVPLPGGWILPIELDTLAILSASGGFPGFVGTLNALGSAGGSIPIPNDASLVGLPVWVAMLTYTTAGGLSIRGTSPASGFVVQ